MTRPRAVSLSSTSGDEVRELTPAEVARLASRADRRRPRRQPVRNRPADREVIVISDSESPVRGPSFQERLAQARHSEVNDAGRDNFSEEALWNRQNRHQQRLRFLEEQSSHLAQQEQLLERLPVYAALGFDVEPRPAIRRRSSRRSPFVGLMSRRSAPSHNVSFAVEASRIALHRVLFMPRLNDALDSMSYEQLLELGRRVGDVRPRGADATKIAKLRKRKWKGLKTTLPASAELHACAICIEDFVDTDDVTTLACKHMFHSNCSQKWLKVNATCPVCRASIDGTPAS